MGGSARPTDSDRITLALWYAGRTLIAGTIVPQWLLLSSFGERCSTLGWQAGRSSRTAIGGQWRPGELGEGGGEFHTWRSTEAHHRQRLVD